MIFVFVTVQSCTAQNDEKKINCNRKTADQSLDRRLPKGICVPENYTVDEVITHRDFDRNSKKDVVLRYSTYPLKNGITRYYAIFKRTGDTTFVLKKVLNNIVPPYIKNLHAATSGKDTVAAALARDYPYDLKIEFVLDTIKLSHLIPDYYGKTYEFVFDKNDENWYLKRIKYWIGDLDERDIEQMDLSSKLSNRNSIETRIPDKQISIEKFNLIESRKLSDNEEKDYFMERYNLLKWSERNRK